MPDPVPRYLLRRPETDDTGRTSGKPSPQMEIAARRAENKALANAAKESGMYYPRTGTTQKTSVLVADSERAVVLMLARSLTQSDYDVTMAFENDEALRLLQSNTYDVLMVDLHLSTPQGQPLEWVARQINPNLAVIVIAGANDIAAIDRCLTDGVYDYITKPFDLAHVAPRVENALVRRRLQQVHRNDGAAEPRPAADQTDRVQKMFRHFLDVLMQVLEAKDEATYKRSGRVAALATALANRIQPDDHQFFSQVRVAALFHDIGIVGIPDVVLHKEGKLTPDEAAEMRRHAEIGEKILRPLFEGNTIVAIVRGHHEQWNGNGYPDGLAGESTPLGARIISVADSYDAMTSARRYRAAMEPSQALHILSDGAGEQWDPLVVDALLAMADEGRLDSLGVRDTREDAQSAVENAATSQEAPSLTLLSELQQLLTPPRYRRPIVQIRGDIHNDVINGIRDEVNALLAEGKTNLILDMHQAGAIDAAGVSFVYLLHLQAQQAGGKIALRDVPDHIMAALREARVNDSLSFENSALSGARPALAA